MLVRLSSEFSFAQETTNRKSKSLNFRFVCFSNRKDSIRVGNFFTNLTVFMLQIYVTRIEPIMNQISFFPKLYETTFPIKKISTFSTVSIRTNEFRNHCCFDELRAYPSALPKGRNRVVVKLGKYHFLARIKVISCVCVFTNFAHLRERTIHSCLIMRARTVLWSLNFVRLVLRLYRTYVNMGYVRIVAVYVCRMSG